LLANTEVMIQAIELWQGIDLDLVPCVSPDNTSLYLTLQLNEQAEGDVSSNALSTETNPDTATPENTTESEADVQASADQKPSSNAVNTQQRVVLVFDCDALAQLKPLSQELQSVLNVTSSSVDLRVQLDQLSVTSEEMALIDTGAVVVIPAAFQANWDIVAVSETPDVPLRFGGHVKHAEHALELQLAHYETASSVQIDTPGPSKLADSNASDLGGSDAGDLDTNDLDISSSDNDAVSVVADDADAGSLDKSTIDNPDNITDTAAPDQLDAAELNQLASAELSHPQDPDSNVNSEAAADTPERSNEIQSEQERNQVANHAVTVWCDQLCSIPVKELLGVHASAQATPLHSLDAQQLSLVQGNSIIAHGSLLSYGRGSVVAVSQRTRIE